MKWAMLWCMGTPLRFSDILLLFLFYYYCFHIKKGNNFYGFPFALMSKKPLLEKDLLYREEFATR